MLKLLTLLFLIVSTISCTPGKTIRPNRGHGFVELDENTDPRFETLPSQPVIGWLSIDGKQIEVNGRLISAHQKLDNGDSVKTGIKSGALIQFLNDSPKEQCQNRISNFNVGQLYAENESCRHQVMLESFEQTTITDNSAYNLKVSPHQTILTVVNGSIQVGSDRYIAGQQITFSGNGIVDKKLLTDREIQQVLAWRKKFNYSEFRNRIPISLPSPKLIRLPGSTRPRSPNNRIK